MTEESTDETCVSKLLIDDPSNFQFHAAYLAYSSVYDRTTDVSIRKQLNQYLAALQQSQIDYSAFYDYLGRFRGEGISGRGQSRGFIKTQKKREWRRKSQKRERIGRHRR